jgi:hypothetical protein
VVAELASKTNQTRETLDRDGIARIAGIVDQDWIAVARGEIARYLAEHGPGDYDIVDPSQWECPQITALADDPRLEAFLDSMMPAGPPDPRQSGGYDRRTLRILQGTGGVHCRTHFWHYDGCALTMVLPIIVPDDGTGQLAAVPQSRPHRRSATISAVERVFVLNKIYRHWMRRRFERSPSKYTFPLAAGDAYLFRGYRTSHAALPWPPGVIRVTVVLHYGHPYGPEGRMLRAGRAWLDMLRSVSGNPHHAAYPAT